MAQLKDTTIDGSLNVNSNLVFETADKGINALHPTSNEYQRVLYMSQYGNVSINYDGYLNDNADANIYGKEINFKTTSGADYKPYYSAGDSMTLTIYTAGFVTSSGTSIRFLVPLAKPIVGNPTITITSVNGITLRQGNKYTHGSSASASVKPASYSTIGDTDGNAIAIVATMSDTTNVTNNDSLGVYWNGTITFS